MNSGHDAAGADGGALLALLRSGACRIAPKARSIFPRARISIRRKLEKIGEFFRNEVATGKIPGAILLIQQHGKPVYHESFGVQDVVSKAPMTDQTIFRLSSMTKAITSVVAMQLIDEGKLTLEDPIAKYIPSFANVKVGVEKKADDGTRTLELVPPDRPPTILDLMRHTSGITYGFYGEAWSARPMRRKPLCRRFRSCRIRRADRKAAIAQSAGSAVAIRPFHRRAGPDHGDRIRENPCLRSRREKLLDPLGMRDTGFFVTDPEK